jgi:hypothetical protein
LDDRLQTKDWRTSDVRGPIKVFVKLLEMLVMLGGSLTPSEEITQSRRSSPVFILPAARMAGQ